MSDEEEYNEPKDEQEEEDVDREDREMLFLIEFLVDTLCVNLNVLYARNIDPCMLQGQSCVTLTFLNFPEMTICEQDWGPENDDNSDEMVKFNAGKSLMFALSDSQFDNPPPIYLDVSAFKMVPHESPLGNIPIGKTRICLNELFKQVFDKIEANPDKLPISKSIKDTYQLAANTGKKPAGEVSIYIRLSCLGQNVVTEFQRGGDECDPFLFKNKESEKVYECKPKEESEDEAPACSGRGDSGEKPKTPCFGASGQNAGLSVPQDSQEYDEFGTEVHGHSLTIKIQKFKKEEETNYGDGENGKPGNQITFTMPKDQTICAGGKNHATVLNLRGCNNDQVTAAQAELEEKDIFMLRIGKKGEVNGKGKLELELKTPKQKIDNTPKGPQMVNKDVQTDKEEQPKKKGKKK